MQVPGLSLNEPMADEVQRLGGVDVHRLDDVDSNVSFVIESLYLAHHSSKQNYRPYLRLKGEIRDITPETKLPGSVNMVTYTPGHGPRADMFYEFDDDQVISLIQKGYFSPEFKAPDELVGSIMELPMKADFVVVAPSATDEAPIVYAEVASRRSIQTSFDDSLYDLEEQFTEPVYETDLDFTPDVEHAPSREGLFADHELDEPGLEQNEPQVEAANEVERSLRDLENAPVDEYVSAPDETSPDYLYESVVAPGVESDLGVEFEDKVDEPEQVEPAPVEESKRERMSLFGDDDFDDVDDEIGVAPIHVPVSNPLGTIESTGSDGLTQAERQALLEMFGDDEAEAEAEVEEKHEHEVEISDDSERAKKRAERQAALREQTETPVDYEPEHAEHEAVEHESAEHDAPEPVAQPEPVEHKPLYTPKHGKDGSRSYGD